jgi:hypothetical protein
MCGSTAIARTICEPLSDQAFCRFMGRRMETVRNARNGRRIDDDNDHDDDEEQQLRFGNCHDGKFLTSGFFFLSPLNPLPIRRVSASRRRARKIGEANRGADCVSAPAIMRPCRVEKSDFDL